MADEKQIAVHITHKRMLCPQHGEPFRDKWPRGYAEFIVKVTEWLFGSESILQEVKKLTGEERPCPSAIMDLLDDIPGCCRLPPDKLVALYKEVGIGKRDRCRICGERKEGTMYKTSERIYAHACFDCVVYQMEPLQ